MRYKENSIPQAFAQIATSQSTIPILVRRHSRVVLEVFEEKRRVGEVQLVGDFLDAQVAVFQHLLGFEDDVLVDPLWGGEAAGVFHNLGEVFGRDAQLVGIEPHATLFAVVSGDQFDKPLKDNLVSCRRRFLLVVLAHDAFVDETAEEIEHRRNQVTDAFAGIDIIGMYILVNQLNVFCYDGEFFFFKPHAGIV